MHARGQWRRIVLGTYASARVGAYLVSALLDGVPVAPPASVAVLPGRTSAAASALAPAAPSVVVGTPAAVAIIHARDAHGNGQLTGGDRWEVRCVRDGGDGAAAVWSGVGAVAAVRDYWSEAATVCDRGDGTYAVEVHASAAGRYALSASLLHSAPRGPQPLDPYESDLGGGSGHRERHEVARPLPQPPLLFDATAAPLSELCSVEWLLPPHPFVAGELRVLIRAADGHGNGVTTLPPGASAFFERLRDDDESAPPLRVTARLVGVGESAAAAASGAPSVQRLHHRHADPPPTPLSGATMLARSVFGDAAAATAAATPPPTPGGGGGAAAPGLCMLAEPTVAGRYVPVVVLGGGRMLRAPDGFAATVVPAAASATLSYAHGAGLAGGVAGETQSFHVALRDVYGNPIDGRHASIERALAVRVTREGAPGEAPAPIDVTEVERGVVQIDWCAPRARELRRARSRRAARASSASRGTSALRPARPFAAACVASGAGLRGATAGAAPTWRCSSLMRTATSCALAAAARSTPR